MAKDIDYKAEAEALDAMQTEDGTGNALRWQGKCKDQLKFYLNSGDVEVPWTLRRIRPRRSLIWCGRRPSLRRN